MEIGCFEQVTSLTGVFAAPPDPKVRAPLQGTALFVLFLANTAPSTPY